MWNKLTDYELVYTRNIHTLSIALFAISLATVASILSHLNIDKLSAYFSWSWQWSDISAL